MSFYSIIRPTYRRYDETNTFIWRGVNVWGRADSALDNWALDNVSAPDISAPVPNLFLFFEL